MALVDCLKELSNDIYFDCNYLPIKGFNYDGVLINRADVDFETIAYKSGSYQRVLTNLPVKTGKRGYLVQQPKNAPYNGTQITMEEGTFINTFTKELHLIVFAEHEDTVSYLTEQFANGEFVAVLRRREPNGKIAYPVFGLETGLHATEITQDFYSDDTNGNPAVVLTETGANAYEKFLDAGSEAQTETLLETLIQEPE